METITDPARLAMYTRAMRKTARPVVLVPDSDAGQQVLMQAARRIPRAVVVGVVSIASSAPSGALPADVVFVDSTPAPHVLVDDSPSLTRTVRLIGLAHCTDIMVSELHFDEVLRLQQTITDLALEVTVHTLPTLREPDGIALARVNALLSDDERHAALALSAALTAGAHEAPKGDDAVLAAARAVFDVAPNITLTSLEILSGRLFARATVGEHELVDTMDIRLNE
ncbi:MULTISPECIES: pantoate--beta-alanine ligase [Corynebacterium]|uniref:Pantoate--beta-alanine ligase n=1 Tax=Corynebacterium glucuronolyticum TaxID=39791 RepID=A0A7T4EGW6_9CORY|nr:MULTISPECIES: pantoate--beta-alanine ligase [Corynebacterium]OFO46305.1 pantoate--beta-alanine ligase [Corynebacterium sp. HMSC073D01]QQB47181.1 pantoate--beta-alanine ligase [Corynebacterium glucuronolyticum]WKD64505.1 Pantothenate synthetase [Corynebacterium glucuronolyticum DSM 44120]SMB82600.1 pantothenate synthetase [Corynebacterium glucuronolyticum]